MIASQGSTVERNMEGVIMAGPATAEKKARKAVKRSVKPRVFYMAYEGELSGEPSFVFDKDELVDKMLENRNLKVKRITVPVRKRNGSDATATPAA